MGNKKIPQGRLLVPMRSHPPLPPDILHSQEQSGTCDVKTMYVKKLLAVRQAGPVKSCC